MKRKLLGILLAAVLLGGLLAVAALATDEADVTYDAKDNAFTFGEGVKAYDSKTDGETNMDLFGSSFKNLMPGDSIEKTLTVAVKNVGSNTVKLTLKADTDAEKNPNAHSTNGDYDTYVKDPATEEHPITLTVQHGDQTETGTLGEGVTLGSFTKDGTTELTVTVSIPLEAGNDVANVVAKVGWVLTAEVVENGGGTPPGGGGGEVTPVDPPSLNKDDHFAYIVGYPDGNVRPQGNITRAEVATIFFRMLTDESRAEIWSQTNAFRDVASSQWFNNAISTLSNGGILSGYEDGTFGPNRNITRAEFATMAVRFFSASYDGEDLFPDIDKHWAQEYINTAASQGIITGYEDGTFRPDQPITRAEAMTIVNRVLERHPDKDHLLDTMIQWPDNLDTAKWYYADVQEATNSHDYDEKTSGGETYEVWTKLLEVRDWAALEKEWSDANSAPGEDVVK